MGPLIGAALISGGSGFLNNLFSARQSRRNTERTIQAQKELAEYSYAKDLEMWNRSNEYNTPAAQMDRLKAGGLNPNLVYGSGSVAGNTSSQIPKYQAYNPQYNQLPIQLPDILSTIGQFQDLRIKKAQTDAVSEDAARKKIENFFLTNILSDKAMKAHYENIRLRNLYGQHKYEKPGDYTDDLFQESPYMRQFQAQVRDKESSVLQREIDTALKRLEQQYFKTNLWIKGGSAAASGVGRFFSPIKF